MFKNDQSLYKNKEILQKCLFSFHSKHGTGLAWNYEECFNNLFLLVRALSPLPYYTPSLKMNNNEPGFTDYWLLFTAHIILIIQNYYNFVMPSLCFPSIRPFAFLL